MTLCILHVRVIILCLIKQLQVFLAIDLINQVYNLLNFPPELSFIAFNFASAYAHFKSNFF